MSERASCTTAERLRTVVVMGTGVRVDGPGQTRPIATPGGFKRRARGSDGTFEPLICTCQSCGRIYEYDRRRGHTKLECNSCKANRWASRPDRIALKHRLIELCGGACQICGYSRHSGALGFHHLDPATKAFTIAGSHTRAWDVLVEEVRKCVLLCENCHREVHAGVTSIPEPVRARVERVTQDMPRRRARRHGRPRL